MIPLAVLALVQVCFLPGWLALRPFPVPGRLTRLLLVFALSLLINYQLVGALTLLGIYGRPAVFAVLAVEVAGALWLLAQRRVASLPADRGWGVRESVGELPRALPSRHILWVAALLCIGWFGLVWLQKIPGVFGIGDDLVSWNRWAVSWAAGELPKRAGYYPQLIPANWSLIYVVTGTAQVHVFTKAMMGLFAVGLLAVPLAVFSFTRSIACLGAVPILAWTLHRLLGLYIGEGYVDIALAYFFAVTWLVLALGFARRLPAFDAVVLSTLVACAALMTKQGAAYLFAATLGCNAWLLWRESVPRAVAARAALIIALVAAVLVAPWYLRQWRLVGAGQENSEWEYQTQQLHGGRSVGERVERATRGAIGKVLDAEKSKALTGSVLAALAVLAAAACRNPAARLALLLGVPYYLLWAALFSYDRRNIAAALPLLAFAISAGAVEIAELIARRRAMVPFSWLGHRGALAVAGGAAALALVIVAHWRFDTAFFLQKQDELIRRAGYAEVNRQLYDYQRRAGLHGAIVTDYLQLSFLPGIGAYFRGYHFVLGGEGVENFLRRCEATEKGPPARYVLLPAHAPKAIAEYVEKHFERIFVQTPYTFYRIPPAPALTPEK